MTAPSLRLRLAAWLLLPLSALMAVCGGLAWRNANATADYVQDRDLLASAKVLSDRLIWEGDEIEAAVPPSALSLFVSPAHDQVFLRVAGRDGRLLAGSPDLPGPARLALAGADRAQWYDTRFRGLALRAVITERSMYDNGSAAPVTIIVAKTPRSRDRMARALWWPEMAYLLAAAGLAVLSVVIALTWELKPLSLLGRRLAASDPMRPEFHLDAPGVHRELRPLVEAINGFARRLRQHSDAQRRFIADAAHQLRTPLALQATQIEFAQHRREHGGEWPTRRAEMDAMWAELRASNRRLVAVTDKLLLLAQAEHHDAQARLEPVDLAQAALHAAEQLAALADRRGIDLGVHLPEDGAPVIVQAQPTLLDAMAANLVDNALRYTQEGGQVTVIVRRAGDSATEFAVEDNGPGIPAEARERVFERFYRLPSQAEGTGLGLPIVREIARAFGARVSLAPRSADGRGLVATVRFPAATHR
jgi:two-component system sensor histidine kinase TctE